MYARKMIFPAFAVVSFFSVATNHVAAQDPADPAAGEEIYNETCIACHGEDGAGEVPGAPDFAEPDGVLSQSDEILLRHILDGFQSEGSQMAMPAKGANEDLTIKDLRDVLSFMHQKFHYKFYD